MRSSSTPRCTAGLGHAGRVALPLQRIVGGLLVALLAGCAAHFAPVPEDLGPHPDAPGRAESLLTSVAAVVGGGGNLGRFGAVRERARELGLDAGARVEWIDWFSLQRNLVLELPGASPRTIYLIAHYDKADSNPFKLVSLLLNGLLDEPFGFTFTSQGAIDNATGVAVVLETAASLFGSRPHYTYRFLLVGSEESGLRGSRAFVARLSRVEKAAIELAINVDSVGMDSRSNCVTSEASDATARAQALEVAAELGFDLGSGSLPSGAASDFAPFESTSFPTDLSRGIFFNLVGGLLPQRSWFTGSSEARVVNFSACDLIDYSDLIGSTVMLPIGRLHGFRDRASRVDPRRLYEQYAIVRALIERLEAEAIPEGAAPDE
jgi:hypothetical protein